MMKRMAVSLFSLLVFTTGIPKMARAGDCAVREYGWTFATGAAGFDQARGIVLDSEGNSVVAGMFEGRVDFDAGKPNANHTSRKDTYDGFIVSYDTNGAYRWSGSIGNANRYGDPFLLYGLTRISADSIAFGGAYFGKADFDLNNGKHVRRSTRDNYDAYVSVLNNDGRHQWTATFEGPGLDLVHALGADQAGNLLITGEFYDTVDLDPTAGVDVHISQGGADAFVVKLASDGSFRWARSWGGLDPWTWGWGVTADGDGNVIVSGDYRGQVDFDPGPGEDLRASAGETDGFIMKFDPEGNRLWTATFGGPDYDAGNMKVAVDAAGNIYYSSIFNGLVDLDPTEGVDRRTGFFDMFLTSLAPDGSYRWTRTVGGLGGEWGRDVVVSSNGVVTVAGIWGRTVDFDPGEGIDERVGAGADDVFLTRYTTSGDYLGTDTFGGTRDDLPYAVAVDANENIVICGQFRSLSLDFDPTTGMDIHSNHSDSADLFITKLYCGPCEAVERHSLTVKKDKIIAEVRALVPGGRVTVVCTPADPPGEPIETRVSIDGNNTGSYKLKKLDKGEYACAITEVRDADGNVVCDEPAGKRVVNVK